MIPHDPLILFISVPFPLVKWFATVGNKSLGHVILHRDAYSRDKDFIPTLGTPWGWK